MVYSAEIYHGITVENVKNNVKWPCLFELFQFSYCCKIWTKIVNQKQYCKTLYIRAPFISLIGKLELFAPLNFR